MMPGTLAAELLIRPARSARPEDFVAHGAIVNTGDSPLTVRLAPLSSPSLALQIEDAGGQPVLLPPPGVPGGDSPVAVLAPGQSHPVEFPGFVPQWTPEGSYRARLRYVSLPPSPAPDEWTGELFSDWAEFTLGG